MVAHGYVQVVLGVACLEARNHAPFCEGYEGHLRANQCVYHALNTPGGRTSSIQSNYRFDCKCMDIPDKL